MANNWYPSRWGADDVLGSFNLVTPSSIIAALSLAREGKVYDLSHILDQDMPVPGFHGSFFANTQYTLENGVEWHNQIFGKMANGYSAQNMRLAISDHSGTHIDQLNHVGQQQPDGEFLVYNGLKNKDIIDSFGTKRSESNTCRPFLPRRSLPTSAGTKEVETFPAGLLHLPSRRSTTNGRPGR